MDTFVVVVCVLLVVAIYFLYQYFVNAPLVSEIRSLKNQKSINADDLDNPAAKKFSYQFWLYLNSSSTTTGTVLERSGMSVKITGTTLSVLRADTDGDSGKDDQTQTITVTTAFPVQKWTAITINYFDTTKIMEVFVNGKLVHTVKMNKEVTVSNSAALVIGDNATDAFITQVIRKPETLDVDTVWKNYLKGNGQSNLASLFMNYDMALSISKDDVLQRRYQLLGSN